MWDGKYPFDVDLTGYLEFSTSQLYLFIYYCYLRKC